MNFVLAALVILGVVFALLNIWRSRDLRHLQTTLQGEMQKYQYGTTKAQALLNEAIAYNANAKNAEMTQIIQSVQPPQTAAK